VCALIKTDWDAAMTAPVTNPSSRQTRDQGNRRRGDVKRSTWMTVCYRARAILIHRE